MSLGEFIKRAREEKGITHYSLFRKSDVSLTYLKNIEENKSSPHPEILKKLAGPLGVKYSALLQAAGYLDEAIDISEAIKHKFGILFKDKEVATVLTTPGVKEILEDLYSLSDSKREMAIKSIRAMLEAVK